MIKAVIFDMFETLITHFETPLYFGKEMSEDMGVHYDEFIKYWRATEDERTRGLISFDDVIKNALYSFGTYSDEVFKLVLKKRTETKIDCFRHLHKNVIPMLDGLKAMDIKIALISNCFSEEAKVIRKSVLFPYFDVAILSCEHGLRKPDEDIYRLCIDKLDVTADECLYIGDGGSHELDAAKAVGMNPLQALWYLKEGSLQPVGRLPEFDGLSDPLDVISCLMLK